ncbi:MAG: homoserine O-acetyltransferase [Chloroflexi bacterium]|nr:homoserine O-acetyltransferase [Chloroflexota bacterium]
MRDDSVGIVETKYVTLCEPPEALVLDSGVRLGPVTIAYETYGALNEDRSNAILVLHALSGDAHAAGFHAGSDKPGWWDIMIGPGRAFDTDRYFVICSNIIGGCQGSTGPSSVNPATGRPFGLDFPVVTVGDMVRAQKRLLDYLGIESLLSVSGGSMGGMQVLQWAVDYPEMLRSAIPIATTSRLSAQGIAFNEVGRQAIMADPNWNNGDYYRKNAPDAGLSVARMIGHITYLSDEGMHSKFGRRLRHKEMYGFDFSTDFEVESYLRHQGEAFIQRFDANSYLYITKAMDYFDMTNGAAALVEAFRDVRARFLVVSFSSDWLFPSYQSKEVVTALRLNGVDVSYCEISSSYGHDAFLLEYEQQTILIKNFLAHTMEAITSGR